MSRYALAEGWLGACQEGECEGVGEAPLDAVSEAKRPSPAERGWPGACQEECEGEGEAPLGAVRARVLDKKSREVDRQTGVGQNAHGGPSVGRVGVA